LLILDSKHLLVKRIYLKNIKLWNVLQILVCLLPPIFVIASWHDVEARYRKLTWRGGVIISIKDFNVTIVFIKINENPIIS